MSQDFQFNSLYVSKDVFDYVWSLTKGLKNRNNYHNFLCYLINLHIKKGNSKKNLSSNYIRQVFGKISIPKLKERGLIEHSSFSIRHHYCRHYSISEKIYKKLIKTTKLSLFRILNSNIQDLDKLKSVNIYTGKKTLNLSNQLSTSSVAIPRLANSVYSTFRINAFYVKNYLRYIFNRHEILSKNTEINKEEIIKLNRVIWTIMSIFSNPTLKKLDDYLFEYKCSYTLQKSGRFNEVGGGFQQAPRFLKWLLTYKLGYKNLDMKNSQLEILRSLMKNFGLKQTLISEFLHDPVTMAKQHGISAMLLKKIITPTLMLSPFKNKCSFASNHYYKAIEVINKRKEKDSRNNKIVSYRNLDLTLKELQSYSVSLLEYLIKNKTHYTVRIDAHDSCWKNKCGMKFTDFVIRGRKFYFLPNGERVTSIREQNRLKRKLLSFIILGEESYFIHKVSIYAKEAGITIYKNEFDGLITDLDIPDEIISKVAKKQGLINPKLSEKKFCKSSDISKYKKLVGIA